MVRWLGGLVVWWFGGWVVRPPLRTRTAQEDSKIPTRKSAENGRGNVLVAQSGSGKSTHRGKCRFAPKCPYGLSHLGGASCH